MHSRKLLATDIFDVVALDYKFATSNAIDNYMQWITRIKRQSQAIPMTAQPAP